MLDGFHDSRLGDLVEHNALGLLLVQAQHLAQMPRDGFSLAVLITCQPNLTGFLGLALQLAYQFLLLVGDLVFGFQGLLVDTQVVLLQVAYVAVARHHFVFVAQEFLDGLGRRLYYHQILLHFLFLFCLLGCKSTEKVCLYLI